MSFILVLNCICMYGRRMIQVRKDCLQMKIERDEFYWRQQSEINSIIAKQAKELEDMVGKFS